MLYQFIHNVNQILNKETENIHAMSLAHAGKTNLCYADLRMFSIMLILTTTKTVSIILLNLNQFWYFLTTEFLKSNLLTFITHVFKELKFLQRKINFRMIIINLLLNIWYH